jgi:hypothetical protein
MNTEQRARGAMKLDHETPEHGLHKLLVARQEHFSELDVARVERAIRALSQPVGAGEGQIGEFVIALLIAAGYVTQEKVDEARKIALGHGPYEMAAPTPPAAAQEDGK